MEIIEVSRLEHDLQTLSKFGKLPSQQSASNSTIEAQNGDAFARTLSTNSRGAGTKEGEGHAQMGNAAETSKQRMQRQTSPRGSSKFYLGGGHDASFKTAVSTGEGLTPTARSAQMRRALMTRKSSISFRTRSYRGRDFVLCDVSMVNLLVTDV
jgi:hypothetical protein